MVMSCRLPCPHLKRRAVLQKMACKDVKRQACHSPAAPSALHMQQRSSLLPCNTMHSRRKQHPHLGLLVPAHSSELLQQTGQQLGLELGQKTCRLQRNQLSLPVKQQSTHMQTHPTVLNNALSRWLSCKGQMRLCLKGKGIWPPRLIMAMSQHHMVTLTQHQKHHMALIAGQIHLNRMLTRCQHQITPNMSRWNQVNLLQHHQPSKGALLHSAQ